MNMDTFHCLTSDFEKLSPYASPKVSQMFSLLNYNYLCDDNVAIESTSTPQVLY